MAAVSSSDVTAAEASPPLSSPPASAAPAPEELAVRVSHLTFDYGVASGYARVLTDVTMSLPRGSRLLLVGDNGAGKSTLLKILSGRHIFKHGEAEVMGKHAFYDTGLNGCRAFLAGDWGKRTVAFTGHGCALQADIAVREMMADAQREFSTRRDFLVSLLGIDLDWRMHRLSDGQRRRVQIMLQLLRPVDLVLLDEITTDLDLITRQDFLDYMKRDSDENGTTIIYATHIFDGLDDWATHLGYISNGTMTKFGHVGEFTDFTALKQTHIAPLYTCVAGWLRRDREARKAAGQSIVEPAGLAVEELRGALGNGYLPGRFSQGYS